MGGCFSGPPLACPKNHGYEYDLIVIGGGSGGIACAREAARNDANVALCDFVQPSPKGTSWGLGGTCVNVGCIPKKLMHQSGLIKDFMGDGPLFGWKKCDNSDVNWNELVKNIQDYISSLNFGYKIAFQQQKITLYKGYAQFEDDHHVKILYPDRDETRTISAQCIVIAVGGRPKYLKIPGGTAKDNLCITSDDIFSLPYPPGRTLCVGAGYIGVECAGFLADFGFDVTLMARSLILREFDVTASDLIASNLEGRTVRILREAKPTKILLVKNGSPPTLKVEYQIKGNQGVSEEEEEFNTVLLATGRSPCTDTLNLKVLPNIKLDNEGCIVTDKFECTGVKNIYAIGDCAKDRPKLTPTAIRGGTWLAQRLFKSGFKKTVDYTNVPTTIFTPIEYGSCGISEEEANKKFGNKNVEVYHKSVTPLEFALSRRDGEAIYAKLICHKSGGKEKVVGFHYLGPNAGEVTVGFSMAVRHNVSKEEIDSLIGIHPTCAEVFTDMPLSKRGMLKALRRQQGC